MLHSVIKLDLPQVDLSCRSQMCERSEPALRSRSDRASDEVARGRLDPPCRVFICISRHKLSGGGVLFVTPTIVSGFIQGQLQPKQSSECVFTPHHKIRFVCSEPKLFVTKTTDESLYFLVILCILLFFELLSTPQISISWWVDSKQRETTRTCLLFGFIDRW